MTRFRPFATTSKTFLSGLLLLLQFASAFSLSMMANTSKRPFSLNVKLTVRPETKDKFLSVIRNDQEQTLTTEPGALQFIVGQDLEDSNTFYLHEQYATKKDFDAHCATDYFGVWQTFCESAPFAEGGEPALSIFLAEHDGVKVPVRDAFCVDVDLFTKPEVRDDFLNVIRDNKKGSDEDEPGCFQYAYGESIETANTFHFHEEYDGKEGFEAHKKMPHFAAWEKFAATDPFTKPPVVNLYKTI
eukprot:CAMPEP_0195507224 /NCGR_PEP_ID=MMETSP0794_2-20130614/718_1 /TAXON_ID=515487 /ORGANISM="Stephanopyxis turris, Strain CCMP 815" /LENGTH=243 /DNA_ID=CAMNT_0040633835 /DNA_START=73 /DNA_END=804 /DNA_ORIENTATION=-